MKLLLLLGTCVLFHLGILAQTNKDYIENSIFVKLKPEYNNTKLLHSEKFQTATFQTAKTVFPIKKINLTGNRKLQNTYVIYFENQEDISEAIKIFKQTGMFEYVEPNYGGIAGGQKFEVFNNTPNDALFSRQWGMKNDGTFPLFPAEAGADIKMEQAWDIEQGDPNLIIAVLDSGAKIDHPELAGRLWTNPGEIIDGVDNDGNGFIDDVDGWNFAYNTNNPTDDVGHGTNIIGLLASNSNNNTAYTGINWNSKVMNVKMLNSNNAYTNGAWAVDAIYYAVDNGADIINMSWGGPDFTALHDAIQYAYNNGVVLTAAMMNFDNDVPYYPAAYDETIAVGSIDPDGDRSSPFYWDPNSGSNYGSHIDLIAPGNYTYNITNTSNNNYNIYWGGTSQAAPHVAGVASLLLSQSPTLTPEEIRTILTSTSDDQTGDSAEDIPGWDQYYGAGRLNAFQALSSNLGIQENNKENKIAIYPNPLKNQELLTVSLQKDFLGTVQLYSILGTLVEKITFENNTARATINVSKFKTGMYFLKVYDTTQKLLATQKILIVQ